jgi:predicted thioesterase
MVVLLYLCVPAAALDKSVGTVGINADVLHGAPALLSGSGVRVGILGD